MAILCRLHIPPVHELAPSISDTRSLAPAQIFNYQNQARLAGVISQLALLSEYATDVFSHILADAQSTHARIKDLADRTKNLEQSLPQTQKFFTAPNAMEKMNITSRTIFRSDAAGHHKLVTPDSRPRGMQLAYDKAASAPGLNAFSKFEGGDRALTNYTNPGFFLAEWISEQQKELDLLQKERKKRKKERALARQADREAKTGGGIQKIKRIRYDPTTGKPIIEEDHPANSTGAPGTTPGANYVEDDVEEEGVNELTKSKLNTMRGKVRAQQQATASSAPPSAPPSSLSPSPSPSTQPAPLPPIMASPPTDDFLFTQRGIAPAPPPPPPRVPTTVAPMVPAPAVPPMVFGDAPAPPLPFRDSAPTPPSLGSAPPAPPPSVMVSSPPSIPSAQTAGGPPPPPPPPPPSLTVTPSAGIPAVSVPRPPPISEEIKSTPILDASSSLMSEIRNGIKLRQVEQQEKTAKKTSSENSTDIGEILRRRMAIAGSDTDESGFDDDDDDAWADDD